MLVAHALARGYSVVTMEQSAPIGTKVKIPDVCAALAVPWFNTFQVLGQLKAKFVLEVSPGVVTNGSADLENSS